MTYKIADIKAFGPEFVTKFNTLNIHTTEDLLKFVKDPKGLQTLTEKSGLTPALMDRFVKISQLTRVEGINPQYAELLLWSGIDTPEKLHDQKPDVLLRKLTEVNNTRKLNVMLPQVSDIEKWTTMVRPQEPAPVR